MALKFLFFTVLIGILLCHGEVSWSDEKVSAGVPISEQCKAMNTSFSNLEYIVGSVLKARKNIPTGDCNPCDQYWLENLSHFSAATKELNNEKRPKIIVITEPEPTKDFMNKDFYMEKGKVYEFCAHAYTPPSGAREGLLIYKIPDTKLIKEINP